MKLDQVNFISKLVSYFRMSKVERMIQGIDKDLYSFFVENWLSLLLSVSSVAISYLYLVEKLNRFLISIVFLTFILIVFLTHRYYRAYMKRLSKSIGNFMLEMSSQLFKILSNLNTNTKDIYNKCNSFWNILIFWTIMPIFYIINVFICILFYLFVIFLSVIFGLFLVLMINEFLVIIISAILLKNIDSLNIALLLSIGISLPIVMYGRVVFNYDVLQAEEQIRPDPKFKESLKIVSMREGIILYRHKDNKNNFFVKYPHSENLQEFIQVEKAIELLEKRRNFLVTKNKRRES